MERRTKQSRRSNDTLEKEATTRPPVWKCGEKTLQGYPVLQLRVIATSGTHPNEGLPLLLVGELELNNSSLQPDRDRMSPVLGVELGEYVRDVALHACFAD